MEEVEEQALVECLLVDVFEWKWGVVDVVVAPLMGRMVVVVAIVRRPLQGGKAEEEEEEAATEGQERKRKHHPARKRGSESDYQSHHGHPKSVVMQQQGCDPYVVGGPSSFLKHDADGG